MSNYIIPAYFRENVSEYEYLIAGIVFVVSGLILITTWSSKEKYASLRYFAWAALIYLWWMYGTGGSRIPTRI